MFYGVNCDHNEYNKGFFTQADIDRLKSHGGNAVEFNGFRIGQMMPTRGVFDQTYLAKLDGYVNLFEMNQIPFRFTFQDMSAEDYGRMPNWMLDGHGYGVAPYSNATINQAAIDFWDLDKTVHNDNRQTFQDLWVSLASRYQTKKYVQYGLMNEPYSHCPIPSREYSIHIAQSYATIIEQIVDAINTAAPSDQAFNIFVDRPYSWYYSDIAPVNREITWEDHVYMNLVNDAEFTTFKGRVDRMTQRFMVDFGKPFVIGEYGLYPAKLVDWPAGWKMVTDYLDTKGLAGRYWHEWGVLDGEAYNQFTTAESDQLLTIVYPGLPVPPPQPPFTGPIHYGMYLQMGSLAPNVQAFKDNLIDALFFQYGDFNPDGSITQLPTNQDLQAFQDLATANGFSTHAWIIARQEITNPANAIASVKAIAQTWPFHINTDLEYWTTNWPAFIDMINAMTVEVNNLGKLHSTTGMMNWADPEVMGPTEFSRLKVDAFMPMFYDGLTLDHKPWFQEHLQKYYTLSANPVIVGLGAHTTLYETTLNWTKEVGGSPAGYYLFWADSMTPEKWVSWKNFLESPQPPTPPQPPTYQEWIVQKTTPPPAQEWKITVQGQPGRISGWV